MQINVVVHVSSTGSIRHCPVLVTIAFRFVACPDLALLLVLQAVLEVGVKPNNHGSSRITVVGVGRGAKAKAHGAD